MTIQKLTYWNLASGFSLLPRAATFRLQFQGPCGHKMVAVAPASCLLKSKPKPRGEMSSVEISLRVVQVKVLKLVLIYSD